MLVFPRQVSRRRLHASGVLCLSVAILAKTSQGCASADEEPVLCGKDCAQACKEALPLGTPGSYTSVAKAPDGTLWVAGYNDGPLLEGDRLLWGDLVVGRYNDGKAAFDWKTVDGLPARPSGTCAERAAASWRNGESESGDNVGLYSSLQISPGGQPMVTYYDATNRRLKFAVDDDGWKAFTLKEQVGADVGRFAKMVLVDGKPVVAFLQIEPGAGGFVRSSVVVARAHVAVPTKAEDFRFGEIAVEENNPCTATSCEGNLACVPTTGTCTAKVAGCTPADCGADKACVMVKDKPACVATRTPLASHPNVFGGFVAFAKGPERLGIVVYDRPRGNLVALAEQGDGTWTRTTLDGEKASNGKEPPTDTGNVGVAPSLQIDLGGSWHVSYVDASDKTLRYLRLLGSTVQAPVVVDDGTRESGVRFADGKHVVGDDSALRVEGDTVTIYYQDATVGTLRRASGKVDAKSGEWDLRALPQEGKLSGFFPQIVPGEDSVVNYWEQTDHGNKSRFGNVALIRP